MDEKREMGKSHLKFCRLCPGLSITNPTFEFRQLKIIHDQEICDFPSIFFSIVFLSQHFQWCSSLPTERSRDQEILNLFQYFSFSDILNPINPAISAWSSEEVFYGGIGKYFSLLTFYIIVSSY